MIKYICLLTCFFSIHVAVAAEDPSRSFISTNESEGDRRLGLSHAILSQGDEWQKLKPRVNRRTERSWKGGKQYLARPQRGKRYSIISCY